MIERHLRMKVPRIDPLGGGRYSIMCSRCRRSAVVVARTTMTAWFLLAADGWKRIAVPDSISCPECTTAS